MGGITSVNTVHQLPAVQRFNNDCTCSTSSALSESSSTVAHCTTCIGLISIPVNSTGILHPQSERGISNERLNILEQNRRPESASLIWRFSSPETLAEVGPDWLPLQHVNRNNDREWDPLRRTQYCPVEIPPKELRPGSDTVYSPKIRCNLRVCMTHKRFAAD